MSIHFQLVVVVKKQKNISTNIDAININGKKKQQNTKVKPQRLDFFSVRV